MAALDNATTPFKANITSVTVYDGAAASLLVPLLQGSTITWSEPGRTAVEAMDRGRHQSTPCVEETDDGNVTGSFVLYATQWLGTATVGPYEAMAGTGLAAGWTPVTNGAAHTVRMVVVMNSTVDGGGSQTGTFAYCRFEGVEVGEQEKLHIITGSFVDYENRPTWA